MTLFYNITTPPLPLPGCPAQAQRSPAEPPSRKVVRFESVSKTFQSSPRFRTPFRSELETQNDPHITAKSIPGASQDALAANFLLNITFRCEFSMFVTPGTLKIIDFPFVFNDFQKFAFPARVLNKHPQMILKWVPTVTQVALRRLKMTM